MTQTLRAPGVTKEKVCPQADGNFAANRRALSGLQPGILPLLDPPPENLEFYFARDGSLTAMLPGARWWQNCSLPRRAAQFMFKSLEIRGVLGCFLFPIHAAQLRAALDRLEPHQGVLALVPDRQTLQIILHCEDFSADIASHRLWFAAGENWQSDLSQIFIHHPGLPTPADFIRAISPDQSAADALIAPAQKIFADETSRRAAEIASLAAAPRKAGSPALCVIAPSHFRLWNDAPITLASVLSGAAGLTARLFDSDDPASASPFALAQTCAGADAVVTANLSRGDLPPVGACRIPVVTWITFPRIPTYDPTNPRDALILADPLWIDRARTQGWPQDRLQIATWPVTNTPRCNENATTATLIADTHPLVPPKSINEFSSLLLLWDLIASELRHDPSWVGDDIDAYLAPRLKRLQIDEGTFNKAVFIERLIIPAYQQSIARALLAKGIPLNLHGKGWAEIEEFASHAAGPVTSRQQFDQILSQAGALVHAWPIPDVHPIDAISLPIIRPRHLPQRIALSEIPALSAEIIDAALQ